MVKKFILNNIYYFCKQEKKMKNFLIFLARLLLSMMNVFSQNTIGSNNTSSDWNSFQERLGEINTDGDFNRFFESKAGTKDWIRFDDTEFGTRTWVVNGNVLLRDEIKARKVITDILDQN